MWILMFSKWKRENQPFKKDCLIKLTFDTDDPVGEDKFEEAHVSSVELTPVGF